MHGFSRTQQEIVSVVRVCDETIRNRLEVHKAETRPVLDHYGEDISYTIDSTQSPVRVLRDVLEVLAKLEM